MQKDMPHTERHIERNVLDIHFRANDGAQNLKIYARCFQWEQKSCAPQFECVEESSNASRSRTRDREIALGAYRLCSILQGCVAFSMAHLTVRGKTYVDRWWMTLARDHHGWEALLLGG